MYPGDWNGERFGACPMTEHPPSAPSWCRIWKEEARGVLRRLTTALFALTLAFLTSVVHVSHTCHESSHQTTLTGRPYREAAPGSSVREEASAPLCLACLFLQAIRTTLVTAFVSILCPMAYLRWLRPATPSRAPSGWIVPGFPIRAPPALRQPDHP